MRPTRKFARLFRTARGSQRRTLVIGPVAIKLPRLRRLRAGLRANREERRIWREGWHRYYPELCPILGWLPFGVALVMPAVEIMSREKAAARGSALYALRSDAL